MLAIRLQPIGKRSQKFFRIIISEKTKDVFGKYIEQLGTYNPRLTPSEVKINAERIKYWIAKGAEVSPTIHNLLVDQKIIDAKKITSWRPKKKKPEDGEAKPKIKAGAGPAAKAEPAKSAEEHKIVESAEIKSAEEKKATPSAETTKPEK